MKCSRENTSDQLLPPLAEFVLSLTPIKTSSTAKTGFDHPACLTTQDTSPPISIPSAYLDEIKLRFRISPLPYGSPRLAVKRRLDFGNGRRPESDMLFSVHCPEERLDSTKHSQPIPNYHLQPRLFPYEHRPNDLFVGQDFSASAQDQISPEMCSQNFLPIESGTAGIPYYKRTPKSNTKGAAVISLTDLARLIDIGLRSMICDKVVHKTSDINVLSISERPKLSEIAPGLFSPGYIHVSEFNIY